MKLNTIAAIGFILFATTATAEPGLPPEMLVQKVLDEHPMVLAAKSRTEAARASAQALRSGAEEFTLTTTMVRRSVDLEGRYGEYDATLMRPLRLPGKARLDRAAGDMGIVVAENRAEDVKHQLAVLLSDLWWDWLGAGAEEVVNRQAVDNLSYSLAGVRRRHELRDASQLEIDQAEAALGAAKLQAEQSVGRMAYARARLMSQFPGLSLPDKPEELTTPAIPEGGFATLRDLVVARSHEIAAAQAEASRMRILADRARRDRLADPTLGIRAFSERNGQEKGVGIVASIPIGGSHRRAISDRAASEASASAADASAVMFDVMEMADGGLAKAQTAWDAWSRSRDGAKAQVAAVLKMRRGYDLGAIDLADLLFAERQTQEMFRLEAQARTDALRAITRLRIDSHELWIGDDLDSSRI